jgi:pSer/pThr/pTyr-binding forkhead associated (FHA) protein
MPRLILRSVEAGSITHELTEELITLGRSPDNMIVVDDASVSGRHAQLQRSGDVYRLRDLNSTNGTRVNSETITEVPLRFGDRLRFGKVEARFEADVSGGAEPLPELAPIEAKPAEVSVRPADFANASPFPNRKKEKDPTRIAVLAMAAIAVFAFLGSMIAVLFMHAPVW